MLKCYKYVKVSRHLWRRLRSDSYMLHSYSSNCFVVIIGVCLRSSTSPAWPDPTERRVAGGKSRYNYEYDHIRKVEKNNLVAGATV